MVKHYHEPTYASKEVDVSAPAFPIDPNAPATPEAPPVSVEEPTLDSKMIQVIEWRMHWLLEAGYSPEWAATIAKMTINSLIDMGYSEERAAHCFPDFWRLAVKAMECGDESKALYMIGVTSGE